MKCCMVACINILYWGNWSTAASAVVGGGGGRVGGFMFFTRFRPFGVDLQKKNFHWNFWLRDDVIHREIFLSSRSKNFQWKEKFCKSTPNGLKRVKKHETADPSATADRQRRPIFPVEYVNASYHTTFHQNISINVACIHKRAFVPWKWLNGPLPLNHFDVY